MNLKMFIDLDGVMVDLNAGLKSMMNFQFPPYSDTDQYRKTIHDMWFRMLVDQPMFWRNLQPMKGYMNLYNQICRIDPEPMILSATPEPYAGWSNDDCVVQKTAWVMNRISPSQATRTIITKSKLKQEQIARYPDHKCVLIDDHPGNIKRWNAAGGIGILHRTNEETIEMIGKLK